MRCREVAPLQFDQFGVKLLLQNIELIECVRVDRSTALALTWQGDDQFPDLLRQSAQKLPTRSCEIRKAIHRHQRDRSGKPRRIQQSLACLPAQTLLIAPLAVLHFLEITPIEPGNLLLDQGRFGMGQNIIGQKSAAAQFRESLLQHFDQAGFFLDIGKLLQLAVFPGLRKQILQDLAVHRGRHDRDKAPVLLQQVSTKHTKAANMHANGAASLPDPLLQIGHLAPIRHQHPGLAKSLPGLQATDAPDQPFGLAAGGSP